MFNLMGMMGNYDDRKVADMYEDENVEVSTCRVTDAPLPYETAVSHAQYNSGKWVIVDTYETEEAAKKGHDKWIKKMTVDVLPDELVDVGGAEIGELVDAAKGDLDWRIFKREDR